ncbi:aminotransferase class I/II-fold pyridoxal phosphate-dependent enzyme [Streptomyces sp. NPDC051642]|uniref:aminotransferase class I/II-fold pyridoxal phosphate-dependent enzyme n=1 Tax=Streptomyces sp. NPDC051642 TaxID=3154646 RepID=UPI003425841F
MRDVGDVQDGDGGPQAAAGAVDEADREHPAAVASVERRVAEGALGPGAALPPVRRLADGLRVSPGTVATAYKELRQRGIVATRGRGGTVVAQASAVASPSPGGLAGLGLWASPSGVSADPGAAFAALPGARSHRSTPRLARLEEAVRDWLRPDGVPVEHVTFAHGALDLIGRLLSVELRPGDAVAMEDPGYHHLLDLVTALGLRMVPVAVADEGMRPDALRAALRVGVRAVVCSPRAQNPYGGCFSAARRDALVEILQDEPEVLVVENDHASSVAAPPLWSLTSGGLSRWVHVRTVSKFLGTDPQWAAAACDSVTPARHDGRMLLTSGWVSHLLQETVHGLMTDDGTRAQEAYVLRRETLRKELGGRGIDAHGASGMNLWVPVRDESAVVNGLRSYGWWVAAGARFRLASEPGVRISVAELEPADAVRLASDFAAVLGEGEPEATYGG